jgi:SAM-dependent methyltransferase
MKADEFNEVWEKGDYRRGSTALRHVGFMTGYIPAGSTINDYGSGTGRAEIELLKLGYKVNMVDFADVALEEPTYLLINAEGRYNNGQKVAVGENLTYTVSDLAKLPDDFPVADWGICMNVLMTCEPLKLDNIMQEMRRTCHNLIIEVYERPDVRLDKDWTTIKGNANFWFVEMTKWWPKVESVPSPEHPHRYITIGREE